MELSALEIIGLGAGAIAAIASIGSAATAWYLKYGKRNSAHGNSIDIVVDSRHVSIDAEMPAEKIGLIVLEAAGGKRVSTAH